MRIPRLLVFSLLIVTFVTPILAQSPSDNIPGSFYSEPPGPLPPDALSHLRLDPLQRPIDVDTLYLPYSKADGVRAGEHVWNKVPSHLDKRALTRDDVTCLSIRSYRVTRDDPESDTTRLVGYSTCQPATRYQVKEAVERQAIVPR